MMNSAYQASAAYADSKPHYALLDGLRGVAALLVLWYHVFEGYAFVDGSLIRVVNHGYLGVDFFFMLSGFVLAYAYNDRWPSGRLTLGGFFRRRLIRLHPMVVMCAVLGAVAFLLQGSVKWDGTSVPFGPVMLALLCAMFFIPAVPGCRYEVRGNGEMFPLNGPAWSLFFEYIGNIVYAFVLRRLSGRMLAVLTAVLAGVLAWFTIADVPGEGMFGVGWTLNGLNFWGGMVRMLFPFSMGMLLQRYFRPVRVRGAFWWCALLLAVLFHVPYIAGSGAVCLNGVFEAVCIIVVFPVVLWLGASGTTTDRFSTRVCKFLGDISYPVYIVHYPLMYLFYAWLRRTQQTTLAQTWPQALAVCAGSVVLAYVLLKVYDEPVRRRLTRLTSRRCQQA